MDRLPLEIDQILCELWAIYCSSGKSRPLLKSDIDKVIGKKIIRELHGLGLVSVEYISFYANNKNTGTRACLVFTEKAVSYCDKFYPAAQIIL